MGEDRSQTKALGRPGLAQTDVSCNNKKIFIKRSPPAYAGAPVPAGAGGWKRGQAGQMGQIGHLRA